MVKVWELSAEEHLVIYNRRKNGTPVNVIAKDRQISREGVRKICARIDQRNSKVTARVKRGSGTASQFVHSEKPLKKCWVAWSSC